MGKRVKKDVRTDDGIVPPRRFMTAFLFYQIERRPTLKKEQPDLSHREVFTVIGEEWGNMLYKQKEKYIKMAIEDKARYDKEIEIYRLQKGEEVKPRRRRRCVKPAQTEV